MVTHELTALAEKYERWSVKVDGKETPECMAREYRAIAAGLRLLAGPRKTLLQELYEWCRGCNDFRLDSNLARRVQSELAVSRPVRASQGE